MSENKYQYLVEQWKKFENKIDNNRKDEIDTNLKEYIEKIKEKNLTIEEYSNQIKKSNYFCNYIENTSAEFYGSAKPGNAKNYGIYMGEDEKYHFESKDKVLTEDEGKEKFEKIKEYLKMLVKAQTIEEISTLEQRDDRPIKANQMLKKIIAYKNMGNYLFAYSDHVIDSIYDFFIKNGTSKINIEKNFEVTKELKTIFKQKEDETENDSIYMIRLSKFIWSIFGSTIKLESKNMILHGAPGTGKTYSIKNTVKNIILKENGTLDKQLIFTQFHPSYSYEDFIDGIKPTGITENGQMTFGLKNGSFKELCCIATKTLQKERMDKKSDKELTKYFFVADEINRAELSRVFGELLICLEEDYRIDFDENGNILKEESLIVTQNAMLDKKPVYKKNDKNYFGVPSNLYFIGTMNDIDRSVDSFDMALRRRFFWKEIRCNYDFIDSLFNNSKYTEICRNLNKFITGYKEEKSNGKLERVSKIKSYESLRLGTAFELGHAYFKDIKSIDKKELNNLWNSKLEPLLKEYLRAEYSQDEIIGKLDEAKKIFTLTEE